eukprot:5056103-Amphidinium_carterae.1
MGSRVGLGKARHVAVRHLWLQQLVADKTVRQRMVHAKQMLGLMEPDQLTSSGYEIPESSGVRD